MNNELTRIVFVLDRSGSMHDIRDDAIGGFNSFIEEQSKVAGKAEVTLIQFDHEYDIVYSGKPIEEVEPLSRDTYLPRGSTALLDAIGTAVTTASGDISKLADEDKPGNVIIAVFTDGFENHSREYTKARIEELVNEQTKAGWLFMYLSSDLGAVADASGYGFAVNNIYVFEKNAGDVKNVYDKLSNSSTCYRTPTSST